MQELLPRETLVAQCDRSSDRPSSQDTKLQTREEYPPYWLAMHYLPGNPPHAAGITLLLSLLTKSRLELVKNVVQ